MCGIDSFEYYYKSDKSKHWQEYWEASFIIVIYRWTNESTKQDIWERNLTQLDT